MLVTNRWCFAAAVFFLASCVAAQDDAAKEPATLHELINAAVEEVGVFASADAKQPARPQVVLRWANNTRGSEDGSTLLYIHDGRPLAAACLYPWQGYLMHDFEAISSGPIVARRNGAIVWQPKTTAVTFADVPEAPRPEATRPRRLRQMKSLAGQFQSTMLGWKSDDSDREELRLLPRPLYRYETTDATVFDGAVFAFVMGTDPESLLLLEAVRDGETAKWRYAFARRTSGELEGRYREKVVWTAARYVEQHDSRQSQFSLGRPLPSALLAPAADAVE
jgi:hypothetical protein